MVASRWQPRALLAVCFGTLAVHGGETSPVPVSAEMLSVLEGAGVSLREELVADVNRERPPSESIVLLGGLARLCEHDAVVRLHVASCARANATLVALLQHCEPDSLIVVVAATGLKTHSHIENIGNFHSHIPTIPGIPGFREFPEHSCDIPEICETLFKTPNL
ncbi:hypothetical protein T492DRAFT_838799 [Pavlovales sp. CCMP2436]|nr:hypothetical protein T492DRAFT_838799 [Pavlovales sp. CCMP2436]